MKFFLITILISFTSSVNAAFENTGAGARPLSLANALVAEKGEPFALYYNPAGIEALNSVFLSYRNFYNLAEIARIDLTTSLSIFKVPLAMAVSRFGNNLYQEIQVGLGSSYTINDEIRIGLSAHLYQLNISGYGSSSSIGINLGVHYEVTDQLLAGAMVSNINRPQIGQVNEDLPQTFSLGFNYQPLQAFSIAVEFYRDLHFGQDYRAGICYEIISDTEIRFGFDDQIDQFSIGIGSGWKDIQFDYALILHQILGPSHSATVGIHLW